MATIAVLNLTESMSTDKIRLPAHAPHEVLHIIILRFRNTT